MDERQAPEDSRAELRLRALMALLAERGNSWAGSIAVARAGVAGHTSAEAERARQDVLANFKRDTITDTLDASLLSYLDSRFNVGSRADPEGITRAEQIRRALVDAEQGSVSPGVFTHLWKELLDGSVPQR